MAGLTLDTGALIAADRLDRRFWTFWKLAMRRGVAVTVPASALAEAWRGARNANMSRVLAGCRVEPLSEPLARRTGELLGRSATADSVDAAVVTSAARRGDAALTSDPRDLSLLASRLRVPPQIIDVSL